MTDFTAKNMRETIDLMENVSLNEGPAEINTAFKLILSYIKKKQHDARNDPGNAKNLEKDHVTWKKTHDYVNAGVYGQARALYTEMDVVTQQHMQNGLNGVDGGARLYQGLAKILIGE